MIWPFHHKALAGYWLKVFAWYAITEACIQLLFFFILNNFGTKRIGIIEFHLVMWLFQCMLIWPIWWVAWLVRQQKIVIQILVNTAFYAIYSYCWFGPVQDAIGFLYNGLQEITRAANDRQIPYLDRGSEFSYLNYQLLKHAFRLSWFFLAAYFYNYRAEEKKRTELAVANKELQLKLLKWHLNPTFYFKTIDHLQQLAAKRPANATGPILQLAKVMEYVIYEAKEKLIDVKKEIQFLNNYTQLLNQQNNTVKFETETCGDYDKLKISPLLLAGFIDKMSTDEHPGVERSYRMQLQFSGKEMVMIINQDSGNGNIMVLLQDDNLQQRLTELYPNKFSFSNSSDDRLFKLSIMLHEER